MIPATPPTSLFPWETAPQTGEGVAGRYLDFVHTRRKEKNTMKITLVIEPKGDDVLAFATALMAFQEAVNVTDARFGDKIPRVVTESEASEPAFAPTSIPTFTAVHESDIRHYLHGAIAKAIRPVVSMEYVSVGGNRTVRDIVPTRISGGLLYAKDMAKDELRSFVLDGITSIKGPVLR